MTSPDYSKLDKLQTDYQRRRIKRRDLRARAIAFYGGRCAKCGFTDERALQFDHIHGGGGKHLKKHGSKYYYYQMIIDDGGKSYQLLCANCNWIKRAENMEKQNAMKLEFVADPSKSSEANMADLIEFDNAKFEKLKAMLAQNSG